MLNRRNSHSNCVGRERRREEGGDREGRGGRERERESEREREREEEDEMRET